MPLTWGAIVGVGLTAWAYESRAVRRWGEMACLVGVVVYLVVGVLAGENLRLWLTGLPDSPTFAEIAVRLTSPACFCAAAGA